MKIPIFTDLAQTIGIDLGSAQTRIWTGSGGLVLDEPTQIAMDSRSRKVFAVGKEAQSMIGRVSRSITLYQPVKEGYLYDFEMARVMIRIFLQKVLKNRLFLRPIIMASVPAGATQAQRLALVELLYAIGAREVYVIAQPLAAAIGSGVPIADASGSFIFQLGSGIVEAAVISLGSLVRYESSSLGGAVADERIRHYLHDSASLVISLAGAQKVKHQVGSVTPDIHQKMLITGQDVIASSPKEVEVTSDLLLPVLEGLVFEYEKMLKRLFTKMPPELTSDVIDKGMLLSGGWSQLAGLETHLVNTLGIPVSVVEDPELSVIKGIGTALEHLELFKQSLGYQS